MGVDLFTFDKSERKLRQIRSSAAPKIALKNLPRGKIFGEENSPQNEGSCEGRCAAQNCPAAKIAPRQKVTSIGPLGWAKIG